MGAMRKNGLALGGSLDNAVVVGKRTVLNDTLRFPDEFVRHKILDLIGDLALLGRPLVGHVIARNGGHALNHQLLTAHPGRAWLGAAAHAESADRDRRRAVTHALASLRHTPKLARRRRDRPDRRTPAVPAPRCRRTADAIMGRPWLTRTRATDPCGLCLVLGAVLSVWAALGTPGPAQAQIRVSNLSVFLNDLDVTVQVVLLGALPPSLHESLHSGVPTHLRFIVELWQYSRLWVERRLQARTVERQVTYNVLTKEYKVASVSGEQREPYLTRTSARPSAWPPSSACPKLAPAASLDPERALLRAASAPTSRSTASTPGSPGSPATPRRRRGPSRASSPRSGAQ